MVLLEPEEELDRLLPDEPDDTLDDPLDRLLPDEPELLTALLDRVELLDLDTLGVLVDRLLLDEVDLRTAAVELLDEVALFIRLEELLLLLEVDGRETTCLVTVVPAEVLLLLESEILRSFVELSSGLLLLLFRVEYRP